MFALIRSGVRFLAFSSLLAGSSFGSILFQDNFDSETPALNSTLGNWYIYRPGVDVVADNTHLIRCSGNAGNCVDLDGTYMQGVYMWSNSTFQFLPGFQYVLTLRLSGNQRLLSDTDRLIVRLGSTSHTFDLLGSSPWQTYTLTLNGNGTTGRIWFDMRGPDNASGRYGDNIGILLDALTLDEVALNVDVLEPLTDPLTDPILNAETPEPASLGMMGLGLAIVLSLRRRATAQ